MQPASSAPQRTFLKKQQPLYRKPLYILGGFLLLMIMTVVVKNFFNSPSSIIQQPKPQQQDTQNAEQQQQEQPVEIKGRIDPGRYQEVLSWHPRIFKIKNFVSKEECDQLIKQASKRVEPVKQYKGSPIDIFPLSSGQVALMDVDWLDQRIAQLTHIPVDFQEKLALIKYEKGNSYKERSDQLALGQTVEMDQHILEKGNRVLMLMISLNDDYTGGHIQFPNANKLTLRLKRGDALLVHLTTPKAFSDVLATHSVTPVISGDKWVAVKWIRERNIRRNEVQAPIIAQG